MFRTSALCAFVAAFVAPVLLLSLTSHAVVTVYNNFAAYNAAVGGNHTLFLNFETDKFGNAVVPSQDANLDTIFDIDGTTFSNAVTYSSPDVPSSRVNIGDIDQGIDNEIGPYTSWNGTLQAAYTANYIATGFTGIDVGVATIINFYSGATLVNSTAVGGAGGVFEFFGFVSDTPFNRWEMSGDFYAIDAHYSTTAIPEPATIGLAGLALLSLARRRRDNA